jgi:hypothetical protein
MYRSASVTHLGMVPLEASHREREQSQAELLSAETRLASTSSGTLAPNRIARPAHSRQSARGLRCVKTSPSRDWLGTDPRSLNAALWQGFPGCLGRASTRIPHPALIASTIKGILSLTRTGRRVGNGLRVSPIRIVSAPCKAQHSTVRFGKLGRRTVAPPEGGNSKSVNPTPPARVSHRRTSLWPAGLRPDEAAESTWTERASQAADEMGMVVGRCSS